MSEASAEETKKPGVYVTMDKFSRAQLYTKEFSETFFPDSLNALDQKFKVRFEEPHRRLKASIHRC